MTQRSTIYAILIAVLTGIAIAVFIALLIANANAGEAIELHGQVLP